MLFRSKAGDRSARRSAREAAGSLLPARPGDGMELSRRGLLVAAVGTAGCLSGGGENRTAADGDAADGEPENGAGNESDGGGNATADGGTRSGVDQGFRSWLTDERLREASNLRFDYARGYTETFVGRRVEALELPPERIDGHVTQSGTVVHLGGFDVGATADRIEAADDLRRTGEYEGYVVAEGAVEAGDRRVGFPVAVGEDAVVVGENYEAAIDAHRGNRETLEEVEPTVGVLFDELPLGDAASVAGQLGAPTGTGSTLAEYVSVSGTAHEKRRGGDTTWVYVFEDADDVTPKRAGILASSIRLSEVPDTATDGRVVRLEGEMTLPTPE